MRFVKVAVIGAGITGLATAHELARLGHEVRCYEAETPMAARSTGGTRIFRLAHDRPELVDWALRARRRWGAWSAAAGERLVGSEGTVVSGDIETRAKAMSAAGAPHYVTDEPPGVPADRPRGPFLVDTRGGVVQAAAAGRFLLDSVGSALVREPVTSVHADGDAARVVTASGVQRVDSVVIAAGAGTPALAAQVGIDVPSALNHHARFTFLLRAPHAEPPCWIDRSQAWRPGFTAYGHLAGPRRWAVGGSLPPAEAAGERDRDAVVALSWQLVSAYVAEYVTGALPEAGETVYCHFTPGLGDGLSAARTGAVLAVWGDNLFKFAPVAGEVLARAAVERSVPAELAAVAHPVT